MNDEAKGETKDAPYHKEKKIDATRDLTSDATKYITPTKKHTLFLANKAIKERIKANEANKE